MHFSSFLIAISVILIVTRLFGILANKMGQPAVIGEVVGGIALGPSLFGYFFPALSAHIFPADILPHISTVAQLGIVFYMFVIGMDFEWASLKGNSRQTFFIAKMSMLIPLVFGFFLGIFLFERYAPAGVSERFFAFFIAIALSITAFPVLARILTDLKLEKTKMGKMALSCAAIGDVSAWCLLALSLSFMREKVEEGLSTVVLTLLYIAFMLFVARPLLGKLVAKLDRETTLGNNALAFFFVILFVSALSTEMIGIHSIFGAFLLGVIIPHDSKVKEQLTHFTESLSKTVFLPAFFVFTGLRTEITLLASREDFFYCVFVVLIATAVKLGGTAFAAKFSGYSWRESSVLGILMNTRGLVELVVLNIGLDVGLLSPRVFTLFVIMALVTTLMTSPLLKLFLMRPLKRV